MHMGERSSLSLRRVGKKSISFSSLGKLQAQSENSIMIKIKLNCPCHHHSTSSTHLFHYYLLASRLFDSRAHATLISARPTCCCFSSQSSRRRREHVGLWQPLVVFQHLLWSGMCVKMSVMSVFMVARQWLVHWTNDDVRNIFNFNLLSAPFESLCESPLWAPRAGRADSTRADFHWDIYGWVHRERDIWCTRSAQWRNTWNKEKNIEKWISTIKMWTWTTSICSLSGWIRCNQYLSLCSSSKLYVFMTTHVWYRWQSTILLLALLAPSCLPPCIFITCLPLPLYNLIYQPVSSHHDKSIT